MKLRTRLVVAFLLLSVVPLGAVTFYSYTSNVKALKIAAEHEADLLASELRQRMQFVTAQLTEKVQHLMDLPQAVSEPAVMLVEAKPTPAPAKATVTAASASSATAEADSRLLKAELVDRLGDLAVMFNNVQMPFGRGGGRRNQRPDDPVGPMPPRGQGAGANAARTTARPAPSITPRVGAASPRPSATPTPVPTTTPVVTPTVTPMPTVTPATPPATVATATSTPRAGGGGAGAMQGRGRSDRFPAGGGGLLPPGGQGRSGDRITFDLLGPIYREVFRQVVPESQKTAPTTEQNQRIAREIDQRIKGIREGLKLSAAELQKTEEAERTKADAAVKAAEAASKRAAAAEAAAKAAETEALSKATLHTAVNGNRLDVTLEQDGKVLRSVNAEINWPNLMLSLFSTIGREKGEVPFAVAPDGRIFSSSEADQKKVEALGDVATPNGKLGTTMLPDWIVVTTADPSGSGLRFGVARPVADSLTDLRKTAGRNAGLGLLLIGLAIVGVVPLSSRMTRHLSTLTEGVGRIAAGDYSARVQVKTKDEVGDLAKAFNLMAADVEAHQRAIVGQERIKRELELGRQIQHDMLPHEPMRLGLTEIQGVSVPAREVGGDFFNYFALPSGHVALLVGDVSGKGVGAALLMANIQASLRTRFALGQDLSAIANEIDLDIEANSPGSMYATLFIGIFDPVSRKLRYVNAGHHPQFVLRQQGGLELMGSTGMPVGLLAGHGYKERDVQLAPGDLVFFYTDGCVETESETGDMFGTERLEALLQTLGATSADSVLQHIERALQEFRGSRELYDDATMMAVRVG